MSRHINPTSCEYCEHQAWDNGDSSVGLGPSWECGRFNEHPEWFSQETLDRLDAVEWEENAAPKICGQFQARWFRGSCPICHTLIHETDFVMRNVWRHYAFCSISGDAIPLCGDPACKDVMEVVNAREEQEQQEWADSFALQ